MANKPQSNRSTLRDAPILFIALCNTKEEFSTFSEGIGSNT